MRDLYPQPSTAGNGIHRQERPGASRRTNVGR
jgi:hypothetical protein